MEVSRRKKSCKKRAPSIEDVVVVAQDVGALLDDTTSALDGTITDGSAGVDYYVTPHGDAIPSSRAEFEDDLSLLEN